MKDILDEAHVETSLVRRRSLLPTWIKVFTWIFLIFGGIVPIALILGFLGIEFSLSIYGLDALRPLSLIGFSIISLFALKGVVAFGLWTEKKWAIDLALADGILGIAICFLVMINPPFLDTINGGSDNLLRLEVLFIIPYLIKLVKIRSEWMKLN